MNSQDNRLDSAAELLPDRVSEQIYTLSKDIREGITEIRLRLGRPVVLNTMGRGLVELCSDTVTTVSDIERVKEKLFRNSVFNHKKEILNGTMTAPGGCRVGFCGTASAGADGHGIQDVRDINSVNIRIARQVPGCALPLFEKIHEGRPFSLLAAGSPGSGKTTLLRDLCRLLGGRYTVSLIDERSEIAAVSKGHAGCDVGRFTDIFTGYPKYDAMITAVRVMSPQVIVCDEIGSAEDMNALDYAIRSGVKIVAACHCDDLEELDQKSNISVLLRNGVFEWVALIQDRQVRELCRAGEGKCSFLQAAY
ncbi:MAG: stage III sporulation protein AA [Ruminococcus sp.]|nr:stage III sporulation protein AA [Ruminococcus sp.]